MISIKRALTTAAVVLFTALTLGMSPAQSVSAATLSQCQQSFPGSAELRKRCKTMEFVGHRGRHYKANVTNENTMVALAYDKKIGAGCETDTWPLKSDSGIRAKGIGVILHDETLWRTVSTDSMAAAGIKEADYKTVKIEDVSFAQFQILRTKGGEPLPTLKEWVTYAAENKIACRVEIKWQPTIGEMHELAAIIRTNKATNVVTFYGSPNENQGCKADVYKNLMADPELKDIVFGLKASTKCPMAPADVAASGFKYIALNQNDLNNVTEGRKLVDTYHKLGLKVGNNSSSDAKQWKKDVRTGVDFIIASNPYTLKKWLRG